MLKTKTISKIGTLGVLPTAAIASVGITTSCSNAPYFELYCNGPLTVNASPTSSIIVTSINGLILPNDEETANLIGDTIPGITGGVWGTDTNGNRIISFVGSPTTPGTYKVTITVLDVSASTSVIVVSQPSISFIQAYCDGSLQVGITPTAKIYVTAQGVILPTSNSDGISGLPDGVVGKWVLGGSNSPWRQPYYSRNLWCNYNS